MLYNKFVEFIEISLNNTCSLQCQGCPSLSEAHPLSRELDIDSTIEVIKNFNPKELFICGNDGEPVEHSRFVEFLVKVASIYNESDILVATNGEALKDLELAEISKFKNITFQIAIDGPTQEVHELTRKDSCLESVFQSITYATGIGICVEPIFSRHKLNENFALTTYDLVKEKFGLELIFRDTTIVTAKIRPPVIKSIKGNMEFLYEKKYSQKVKPWFKRIYINSDGNCYPCVSFIYAKTNVRPVSVYDYNDSFKFFTDFIKMSKQFCQSYQALGNTTQCKLNCDHYINEFEYDDIESLRKII